MTTFIIARDATRNSITWVMSDEAIWGDLTIKDITEKRTAQNVEKHISRTGVSIIKSGMVTMNRRIVIAWCAGSHTVPKRMARIIAGVSRT